MTEYELREFSRDCYAALGAGMPAPGSPAWRIWAEMCAAVPLEAATWIRSELIKLDSMPRNFGNAVLRLFHEWRVKTGYAAGQKALCPNCDRETPGFYTAFGRTPSGHMHSVLVRCPCNADPAWKDVPSFPKAEAERRGYGVKQHGESLAAYEAVLLGTGGAKAGNRDFDRVARTMRGVTTRKRHMEYTAEVEGW